MGLSAELQQEIIWLDEHRDEFPYRGKSLGEKTAMLFVGGIGFGKSTVIKEMVTIDRFPEMDIAEVGTITTRRRKPSDPPQYRTADEGMTHESVIARIRQGEMTNWSWIPATGDIYASDAESFSSEITLVPTLPSSIATIKKAGLKTVHVVYIIPDTHDWYEKFKDQTANPSFLNRLKEARDSIEYVMNSTENTNMLRAVNHHEPKDALHRLAEELLRICKLGTGSYSEYSLDASLREGFDGEATRMRSTINQILDDAGMNT